MTNIGIFYGSDTGNTEQIAYLIKKTLGSTSINTVINVAKIYDIAKSSKDDVEQFNILIFGIPTWYYGEAQCDWNEFFPILETIDLNSKTVAIFGCGDQEDYTEYFCDAMGIMRDIIKPKGASLVGLWPTSGYNFEASRGITEDKQYFIGLAIDEDRQPELTPKRVKQWVEQIVDELKL